MVSLKSVLALLALSSGTVAAPAKPDVSCSTVLGPVFIDPTDVPTATATSTQKVTLTVKTIKIVHVVVVPVAKTTTVRSTTEVTSTHTANPNVKVATAWHTDTTYVTVPRVQISTTWSTTYTTTRITTTVTVPTPASFTPIRVFTEPIQTITERTLCARDTETLTLEPGPTGPVLNPSQYAERVDCVRRVRSTSTKKVASTRQGKRQTRKAATKTKVSSITVTSWTTEYPAEVTSTITSTTSTVISTESWTVSYTTFVETREVVSNIPAPTPFYAACASDNQLAGIGDGRPIVEAVGAAGSYAIIPNIFPPTPYKCCVACHKTANCRMSFLSNGACYALIHSQCKAGQFGGEGYYIGPVGNLGSPVWVANGPCGVAQNLGPKPTTTTEV
ncbi:hypothetical protein ACJ41O_010238 [Fusarium nematophilum]